MREEWSACAAVAAAQHGVVSFAQLKALGLSSSAIGRLADARLLIGVHQGVYAVGHARLSWHGRLWAAVLACGGAERAVLSHATATALWDLRRASRLIHITTLGGSHSREGIRVHRHRLAAAEITRSPDGALPVTTPMRALLDSATTDTPHELERACHRAAHLRLLDASAVPPGRRGARGLRIAMQSLAAQDPQLSRSDLEEAFLAIVARAGLPPPRVNARVHGLEVDFHWPAARLAVEADSRRYHLTPAAFERDRRRDATLQNAGHRVLRFTDSQIAHEPAYVVATLTSARPS
jgi:very-short-patch-repair endonuclease